MVWSRASWVSDMHYDWEVQVGIEQILASRFLLMSCTSQVHVYSELHVLLLRDCLHVPDVSMKS